jgi:hypothetical protein
LVQSALVSPHRNTETRKIQNQQKIIWRNFLNLTSSKYSRETKKEGKEKKALVLEQTCRKFVEDFFNRTQVHSNLSEGVQPCPEARGGNGEAVDSEIRQIISGTKDHN